MDIWKLMHRNAIITLLILLLIVCMYAGNVFAQEARVKTAEESAQDTSLGANLPQPSADSDHDTKDILRDDMLSAKTHNYKGIMYLEKGQYDFALAEFTKAIESHPMSAEAYNNRGIAYSRNGQYDLAIKDFSEAIKLSPDDAKAYYNCGITYAIRGQVYHALSDLKRCLELDPTNAAAYDSRGSVLVGLACSDWGNACQLGNCDHLKEAVRIGLCVAIMGNNPLSP